MSEASLEWLSGDRGEWQARLAAALVRVGVGIGSATIESSTPAIALFEPQHERLVDETRELSQGGARRVLMVSLGPSPPAAALTWQLLRAGAGDVLTWRQPEEPPAHEIAARLERWTSIERLLRSPTVERQLIGQSRAWLATLRQVIEIAAFSDGSVLLLGESGTDKELIARLIHTLDRRTDKGALVVLDCTTVVPELAGSEFFGHERGAFTGASFAREGAFALADKGTLFLDEVGELPLTLQAQLLRAVQERTFKRVGGNSWTEVQFRLVCATNRDLASEVTQGGFRSDFFHRIASRVIRVPPLRERIEDILPLAGHFLGQLRPGRPAPAFDAAVAEYLRGRPYPGNVRELRQLVCRIADRHVGDGAVTPGDLPPDELAAVNAPIDWRDEAFDRIIERAVALGGGLREIGRAATAAAIRIALACEGGNVQRAARRLGVTDRALQMRRAQGGD